MSTFKGFCVGFLSLWIFLCWAFAAGPTVPQPALMTFEDQPTGEYSSLSFDLDGVTVTLVAEKSYFSIEDVTTDADARQSFGRAFGDRSLTTASDDPCNPYSNIGVYFNPPIFGFSFKAASNPGHENEPPSVICYTNYEGGHSAGESGPKLFGEDTWPSNRVFSSGIGYGAAPITVCYLRDGRFDALSVRK